MFSERLLAIFDVMASQELEGSGRGAFCAAAAQITALDSVAIALPTTSRTLALYGASDDLAGELIELETTVGEGPCFEALEFDTVCTEEDLTHLRPSRWMFYGPSALALGVRAAFAFPMRIGAVRLGTLVLYSTRPGALSEDQFVDSLLMAAVIGRGILALQAGAAVETLSHELQNESMFDFSVHQAAGMVAVQAEVDIATALVALRMHAISVAERLSIVSARVISRELRFDSTTREWKEGAS